MAKASKKSAPALAEVPVEEVPVEETSEQPEVPAELELAVDVPSVLVHSKLPEGFYRLGQKFTQEPTIFAPGELTEAQLGTLQAEKMLVVKVL